VAETAVNGGTHAFFNETLPLPILSFALKFITLIESMKIKCAGELIL